MAHHVTHLNNLSDAFYCILLIRAPTSTDPHTGISGVYCPLDSHPDLVSHFYSSLAAVSRSIPPGSFHITSDDFNAHLGTRSGDSLPNGAPRVNLNQGPFVAHAQSLNLEIPTVTTTPPTSLIPAPAGSSIIDYTTIPHNLSNLLADFSLLPQYLGPIAHNVWQCASFNIPYTLPDTPSPPPTGLLPSPQSAVFRRRMLNPKHKPRP